jgi:hypothetical protein
MFNPFPPFLPLRGHSRPLRPWPDFFWSRKRNRGKKTRPGRHSIPEFSGGCGTRPAHHPTPHSNILAALSRKFTHSITGSRGFRGQKLFPLFNPLGPVMGPSPFWDSGAASFLSGFSSRRRGFQPASYEAAPKRVRRTPRRGAFLFVPFLCATKEKGPRGAGDRQVPALFSGVQGRKSPRTDCRATPGANRSC